MIMSTVDWEDEVSTKFQMENYSSEDTTISAQQRSSMMPSYLIPFKIAVVAIGVLGILTNGVVLACFCIAGRSKMNSSSCHIANHTTLEHSTCLHLRERDYPDLHTCSRSEDNALGVIWILTLLSWIRPTFITTLS